MEQGTILDHQWKRDRYYNSCNFSKLVDGMDQKDSGVVETDKDGVCEETTAEGKEGGPSNAHSEGEQQGPI